MLNPSYLFKSRHDIYYFRYPIGENRLSISLKTRCPRQALKLAKALAYHTDRILTDMNAEQMEHAELIARLKPYYAEKLEQAKARIDREGQIPRERVQRLQEQIAENSELIENGADSWEELHGIEYEDKSHDPVKADLKKIMGKLGLNFSEGSPEYAMLKSARKHMRRNYMTDLLAYNNSALNFSFADVQQTSRAASAARHKLGDIIRAYLKENKSGVSDRSHGEKEDCLDYLIDYLGADYLLSKIA